MEDAKKTRRERLDAATGFLNPQFKRFPFIKFISSDSSKSKSPVKNFVLLTSQDDGGLEATDLGEMLKCVVIKRGLFKMKKATMSTNEMAYSKGKTVAVYKYDKETNRKQLVAEGEWKAMKEKFGLSTMQVPYVLLEDGTVAKLGVLPSSLSAYWEYTDEFKKEDTRPYEYETVVEANPEVQESEGGTYYQMAFKRGETLSENQLMDVEHAIDDTNAEIGKVDEYYNQKSTEHNDDAPTEPAPETPVGAYDGDVEEQPID